MAISSVGANVNGEVYETQSCTDYVGPYIVKDLLGQEDQQIRFTGGWHGKNGDSTGDRTGKTRSYKIYAGQKIVENNQHQVVLVMRFYYW